jgi:hypothetical protein
LRRRKLNLKIKVTPVESIEEVLEKLGIKVSLASPQQPSAVKIEAGGLLT